MPEPPQRQRELRRVGGGARVGRHGSRGVAGKVASLVLKPKESASTVVNALALQGPDWPQGGYRIEFTFCLGQKAKTMSFYYMARHHDGLRAALAKPAPATQPR